MRQVVKFLNQKTFYEMARNVKVTNKLKKETQQQQGFTTTYQQEDDENIMGNIEDIKINPNNAKLNQDTPDLELIRNTVLYEGDDPYYEKVVDRPEKGTVWGLQGELITQKHVIFDPNQELTIYKLISFLELNQIKDIVHHDLRSYGKDFPQRYGIVGTIYSSNHGWKVCKELVKGFMTLYEKEQNDIKKKNLELGNQILDAKPNERGLLNLKRIHQLGTGTYGKPQICGKKDDEWLMVYYKEFMIHLLTEDSRNEVDIEAKWMYQPTEEHMDEYDKLMVATKTGNRRYFEPLDN